MTPAPERPLPPKIRRILAISAEDHGTTVAAILGRSRSRHITEARCQAGQTLRRMGYSFPEIGRFLGVHHTSVVHMQSKPEVGPDSLLSPRSAAVVGSTEIPCPDLSGEWAI